MFSPDLGKVHRHTYRRGSLLTRKAEMGGAFIGWQANDDFARLLDGRRLSLTV